MMSEKINFKDKYSKFSKHWSPRIIAEMNDYQFKLAKIKGEFIWHNHKDTDEVFIVIEGRMSIDLEDKTRVLNSGEMIVIKKGEKHKPYSKDECKVLIIEPKGVINTGDEGGMLTVANDQWI